MPIQTDADPHANHTPPRTDTHTGPGSPLKDRWLLQTLGGNKTGSLRSGRRSRPLSALQRKRGEKKSGGAGRKRPPPRPARPARRGADAGPRTYSEDPMARPPLPAAPKPPPPAAARPGSSGRPRAPRAGGAAPRPAGPRPRPPRSDVRRLGAGYLWQGYSECSLGRVLIAVPWDL